MRHLAWVSLVATAALVDGLSEERPMLVAKTEMLIRRAVDEVFKASSNPAITSRFWFTSGSGRLEAAKSVRWDWAMYDFSSNAAVKEAEPNRRILVEWSGARLPTTTIEWTFQCPSRRHDLRDDHELGIHR